MEEGIMTLSKLFFWECKYICFKQRVKNLLMAGKDIEKTSRLAVLFTGGQPPLLVIVLSGGISKGPDLFARPFPAFSRPILSTETGG